jgi:exonuclease VII small subunit
MSDVSPPPTEAEAQVIAELQRIAEALETISHGLEHALERWNIETGGT